ncbi:helix-turn-helix transcriptional regulator [Amycolatopsis sp. NPDC023774]|uniref:helix-turn-helix transcriptional regulator n=1 Tax=Amycolatopsis sp. NPDC023774 TaxID=3155015 RepID=UPI0033CCDD3C
MEDHKIVQRNVALQREWYGEPLGDRVRRLVVAFDISQAFLAEVLGISAPMLSQVMSGRRAKIGNPVVLARMIMLERKILVPEVAAGNRDAMQAALEDVRDSRPTVGRDNIPVGSDERLVLAALEDVRDSRPTVGRENIPVGSDERLVLAALREVAEEEDLTEAAKRLDDDFPILAELLRRAGASH